ncbi:MULTISPECIES: hypothetical protein [Burkholderia]|uniref:hypothetical protein n=1 Tax=Burkholderia TaxID=32008 RepID=UPI00006DB335|nr:MULTISPECIES: hypothetical protein [Burkholderia]AJY12178.1 hypothetical protein AK34_1517 [Burkholderia dolosa AU0158]EAY68916.1 hypothetical protein BDAG_01654 [Burkholderia dolosa AU0158]VWB24616.1 hypothetical protein BDO18943_00994 [Burkholderia dolosa]
MDYTPPKAQDLQRLKEELGRTGEQMAELFGVAGGQQWRKYTGGAAPRELSPHILFFGAARLALNDEEFARVLRKMRAIGAEIDVAPLDAPRGAEVQSVNWVPVSQALPTLEDDDTNGVPVWVLQRNGGEIGAYFVPTVNHEAFPGPQFVRHIGPVSQVLDVTHWSPRDE